MPRNAWDSRKRAGSQIQSILISKRNHTLSQARKWLKGNGFADIGVDETEKNYRFRQKHPDFFISSSFRTITLDNGVKAVVGIPKVKRGSKSNPRPFQRRNPVRTWSLTEDCRIEIDPLADVPEFDLEESKPVETVRDLTQPEPISELSLKDWTKKFQSAQKQYNKTLVGFFKAKKENYGEAALDKAEDDYDAAKFEISSLLAQGNKTYVDPIMYRFWALTSRFNIGDTAYLMSSKSPEKVKIQGFTVPFFPYKNEFVPKNFSYDYYNRYTDSNVKETTASSFVSSIEHPIFHHLAKHLYPKWIAKCFSYVVAFHIFYDVRDAMRGNTVWAENEQAVAETKVIIMTKFVKYSAMYFSEFQKYFPLDVDMEDGLTMDITNLNKIFSEIVDYNRKRWDTPFAYAEIKGQDYLLSESVYIKSQQPKQKSPQELAKNFKYATFPFSSVVQAYSGTSQVPEKRAFSFLDDYEHHINAIQEYAVKLAKKIGLSNPEAAVAGDVQNYISKYYSLNEDMLNSRQGLMSSFVAGPANFPKARMDKKSAAVDKKVSNMLEYTEKWKKRLQKGLKELYIQEQGGAASVADKEIQDLKNMQTFMKEANKIVRKKKLSDAEKVRLVLELAKKLELNTTEKSVKQLLEPDFAGRVGFPSYQLTSINNRIKEREKKIAKIERRETAAKEQGTLEIPFESDLGDGKVEYDAGADRLRVYFDDRLSKEDFKKMRSAGFRWAKSLEAFSRNLNNSSVWKAKSTLGLDDLPSVDDYLKGNVQIEPEGGMEPPSEPIKEFELEPKAKSKPVQEIKEERIEVTPEKPKKAVSGRTLDDILGTANKEYINPAALKVMADIVNEANWEDFETSDVRCWNRDLNKVNQRANPKNYYASESDWFKNLTELTKSYNTTYVKYSHIAMLGGTYFGYSDNEIKVLFLNYIVETSEDVTYKLQIVGVNEPHENNDYTENVEFIYDCVVRNLPNYVGELLPAENSHNKAFKVFIDRLLEALTLGTYLKGIGLNLNALEATYLASKLLTEFSAGKIGIRKSRGEFVYGMGSDSQTGKALARLGGWIIWTVPKNITESYIDSSGDKQEKVVLKKGRYIGLAFTHNDLLRAAQLGNALDLSTLPNWISLWLMWFGNFQDTTVSFDNGLKVSNPKLPDFTRQMTTGGKERIEIFDKHFLVGLNTGKSKYEKSQFELTQVNKYFSQMSRPMGIISLRSSGETGLVLRSVNAVMSLDLVEPYSREYKAIVTLKEAAGASSVYDWIPMYETITENDPLNNDKETIFISVTNSSNMNCERIWLELSQQSYMRYSVAQQPSGLGLPSLDSSKLSEYKKYMKIIVEEFNQKLKEDPSFQTVIDNLVQFARTETKLENTSVMGPLISGARKKALYGEN